MGHSRQQKPETRVVNSHQVPTLRQFMLAAVVVVVSLWQVADWAMEPSRKVWVFLLIWPVVFSWFALVYRPILGQWVLLALSIVYICLPLPTPQLLQEAVPLVLCVDGTIRKQHLLVAATIISTFGLQGLYTGDIYNAVVSQLLLDLIAVGLAWGVRQVLEQREAAEEKARSVKAETEREIAAAIHDTTARDLARLVLSLERWEDDARGTKPYEQDQRKQLKQEASESLARLRQLIRVLEGIQQENGPETTLEKALVEARKHLRREDLSLRAEIDPNLSGLPPESTLLVVEAVEELLVNAEKYAAAPGEVELSLQRVGRTVHLFQSNRIGIRSNNASLSGKTGLERLSYRLSNLGGSLETQAVGEMWLVEAKAPLLPGLEELLKGQI